MKRTISSKPLQYNVGQEPLVISKTLLDILLKEKMASNLIALYTFYYYTAKWQGNMVTRATNTYVSKGIGWGEDKVKTIKRRLIQLGLIENVSKVNSKGRIVGHYIRVNLVATTSVVSPPVVKSPRKYYKNNNIKKKINKERNIIPPTLEMVQRYCKERNNTVNAQAFVDFYTSKGWLIGKAKMKDWQAAVRTWESNGRDTKTDIPKVIYENGNTYIWDAVKGFYRDKRTNSIYIP